MNSRLKKSPMRKLSPWDLEKLEPGDLLAVEPIGEKRHLALILEKTTIEDDYLADALHQPGFVIYSLESKTIFSFSCKFLTTIWQTYLVSKGNNLES